LTATAVVVVVAAPYSMAVHNGKIYFRGRVVFGGLRVLRGQTGCTGDMIRGTSGRRSVERIGFLADFIRNWKKIHIPSAFQ
jgi:hypothetical protein